MFSQACVKNSVHGGEVGGVCLWDQRGVYTSRQTPLPLGRYQGKHPPPPKADTRRTIRMLLECILV